MIVNVTTKMHVLPFSEKVKSQITGAEIGKIIGSYIPDGTPLTKLQIEAANRIYYTKL